MEVSAGLEVLGSERAEAKGDHTGQASPSGSLYYNTSCKDLESGINAPPFTQQNFASDGDGNSDATSWPRSHLSTVLDRSTRRISILQRDLPKLPPKQEHPLWRRFRHKLLNTYHRLFFAVVIANAIALIVMLVRNQDAHLLTHELSGSGTAAAANVLAAILIRQENVINALYNMCCMTPIWWPLRVRRAVAKIYHFGGIHSGCACSAMVWLGLSSAQITMGFVEGNLDEPALLAVTYLLLTLIVLICISAIPTFRNYSHNSFEQVHRFAGWTAVGLFWVETLLVANVQAKLAGADPLGLILIKSGIFWILLGITFLIILPWVRLRKVDAFPEILSSHALRIRFTYMKMKPVLGLRITDNPLKEWHAFATIPDKDVSSFSLIVSKAGDWTQRQIAYPKRQYWVRGAPITGVVRMAEIFKKVIIVTTGSGIGPCLSILSSPSVNCRVLWSTPDPLQTYGESMVDEVLKADPDAMIIDTRVSGRLDMVTLTYHLYLDAKAEAVFVISNRSLTRMVVYGMESRGIAAFGPIWDS